MIWKWSELKRLIKAEDEFNNTGAIMWPVVYPTDMQPPEDAHVTVIYFPTIDDIDKNDVLDAIRDSMWDVFLWLTVTGLDWFGPEKNIPVLRVKHDYLEVFWNAVKDSLRKRDIPFSETYPVYMPHVTITEQAAADKVWPTTLLATPVELWWGGIHYEIEQKPATDFGIMLNRDGSP